MSNGGKMGRPEKLTKEQQAEALASINAGQRRVIVAMKYGISEITLRRYERLSAQPAVQPSEPTYPEAA